MHFCGLKANIPFENVELKQGNWKFSTCKVCVCVFFFLQEICGRSSFIFLFFPIFSFYFLKVFEQNSLFIVTFYSAVETDLNGSDKVKYVINYIHSSGLWERPTALFESASAIARGDFSE